MDIVFSKRLNSIYFKNKRNGFFIEAGAYNGSAHSICKWFEDTLNWTGINIEPEPRLFRSLIKNRPNCININNALSNKKYTAELLVPKKLNKVLRGHSTIAEHRKNKFKKVSAIHTVDTITYTWLIENYKVNKVDLFVLDVEGHELEVLENLITCDILPYVLAIETNKISKEDILSLLAPLNYKIDYTDKYDTYFSRSI